MALNDGASYRFKSYSNGQYLNILTDGNPANGTNVTTYDLNTADMAQVWEYDSYTSEEFRMYGHLLRSAKDPAYCLDRYRARSNLNNADVYQIGTTSEDLQDQLVRVSENADGTYTISLIYRSLTLTATTTATYGGYNVNWQGATGGANQKWVAELYSGGSGGTSRKLNISLSDTVNQIYTGYSSIPDIKTYGCALCCGVIVSRYYGSSADNTVEYFYSHYWTDNVGYSWGSPTATMTRVNSFDYATVKAQIDAGRPVIIHADNSSSSSDAAQHWAVAYGYENGGTNRSDILVVSPYNPDTSSPYGVFTTLAAATSHLAPVVYDRMELTRPK